ncbi:spore cortex biosynthesis protein YabQ [Paraliobacillus salinarum]|uniref:spore cortex biosynthesis protein YabQ n=1 Tax=Paraliobacillus salinarum TaxID=1158996 RepID=UPI0015F5E39A|nr:spore cortex biosynthesis protein YabQ [Paraliobacillus salinarum]
MSLTIQFSTIVAMIAGGFYLGCAIDTFRRFDRYWKGQRILSFSLEICFWLLQTLILFYLLFLVNQGELRLYIFLSIFCGIAAYQSLFASIYKRLLERVIHVVIRFYRAIVRLVGLLVIRPILLVYRLLLTILLFLLGIVFFIIKQMSIIIFFPIRLIGKVISRLIPKNAQKYLVDLAGFYSKIEYNIIKRWKSIWHKGGSK